MLSTLSSQYALVLPTASAHFCEISALNHLLTNCWPQANPGMLACRSCKGYSLSPNCELTSDTCTVSTLPLQPICGSYRDPFLFLHVPELKQLRIYRALGGPNRCVTTF